MILDFCHWLLLREQFNPAAYDSLFNTQLAALLPRLNADNLKRLDAMRGGWTNYIAACLRNAGFRDQGGIEEKIHDVVVKLLVSPGGLFRGYDESRHGPLDLRFKRSVSNAVKNIVEKEKNRTKFLRPVPIHKGFVAGGVREQDLPGRPEINQDDANDDAIIERFRGFLRSQCDDLAVAVFNARLEGREMKDLVGLPELNFPSRHFVKRAVQQIKTAAHDFAEKLDDPTFLRRVERLLNSEAESVAQRLATTRSR